MNWFIGLLFSPVLLLSEYRVYELRIVNDVKATSRKVYTTLDWIQYRDYHPLKRDERVELVDHWMCWKRSEGFKPLCKRPGMESKAPKSESQPPEGES